MSQPTGMRVKVVRWWPFLPWLAPMFFAFPAIRVIAPDPSPGWLRLVVLLLMAGLTAQLIRVRRGSEAVVEWDQVGIRCHGGEDSWDVPWGLVEKMEVRRVWGRRLLSVHPDASISEKPFVVPNPVAGMNPPEPPLVAFSAADKPRQVIKSMDLWWPMLISAAVLTGAVLVAGVWMSTSLGLLVLLLLGIVSGGVLFGLRPVYLVVDQFGIRRLGEKRWQLAWPQIAEARVLADTLVVTPGGVDQPTMQITDGQSMDQAIRKLDRRFFRVPLSAAQEVPVQELIDRFSRPGWRSV